MKFECRLDPHSSTIEYHQQDDRCEMVFTVKSPYACPRCGKEDLKEKEGTCKDGKMTVHITRHSSSMCYFPRKGEKEERECGSVHEPLWIVIVVPIVAVALLVVCAAGVVWFFLRSKRLEYQYSQLMADKTTTTEFEMQETGVGVEESETDAEN